MQSPRELKAGGEGGGDSAEGAGWGVGGSSPDPAIQTGGSADSADLHALRSNHTPPCLIVILSFARQAGLCNACQDFLIEWLYLAPWIFWHLRLTPHSIHLL